MGRAQRPARRRLGGQALETELIHHTPGRPGPLSSVWSADTVSPHSKAEVMGEPLLRRGKTGAVPCVRGGPCALRGRAVALDQGPEAVSARGTDS